MAPSFANGGNLFVLPITWYNTKYYVCKNNIIICDIITNRSSYSKKNIIIDIDVIYVY